MITAASMPAQAQIVEVLGVPFAEFSGQQDSLAELGSGIAAQAGWLSVLQRLESWRIEARNAVPDDAGRPTIAAIKTAQRLAVFLSRRLPVAAPPTSMAPDGEGGISLERSAGDVFELIEIDGSGRAEVVLFLGGRVSQRVPVDPGS
jgi:hypothetical protein